MTSSIMITQENNLPTGERKKALATVNSYLILTQNHSVLLLLRKNTGYCDGMFGLISGHVESGEAASSAIIREAHEEAGIIINKLDLQPAHIIHRMTNRINIDIFFSCDKWQGKIENKEPEKCGGLDFYPIDLLPENTVGYIAESICLSLEGKRYSESGWIE